jgi:adenosylcobinamide-GDP ribazoletransferase
MLLAPVAVLPVALLTAGALLVGDLVALPPVASGAVAVGVLALLTRGLHLDGLADTADGLASSYDRDRALTVMRSGDVGPAGVVTLVLTVLVQVACLASVLSPGGEPTPAGSSWSPLVVVVLAVLLSRSVLPLVCVRGVPSARPSGLGATVAGSVPRAAAAVPVVLVAALGALALDQVDVEWWRGPAAALVALAVTAGVVVRSTRRLGGVTGDVLGACVELAWAAALLVLSAR